MIKFRLYFDKDAETKWLNKMVDDGWAMKRFFAGFYLFERCEKGQYRYQVDFGEKLYKVTDDYREFMEDAGVEIMQCWGYWIILRKPASEGEFQLYTDVESGIAHYTKILTMFKVVTVVELICLMMEVVSAMHGFYMGWVFAFLIGALVLGLINVIAKTKNIIAKLNARKTGIAPNKSNRNISALLPVGLLFNSCALLVPETVSSYIKLPLQILAIIFMLTGVAMTCRNRTEN